MAQDRYKGIAAASQGLYRDKGSRFIAYAYPVNSIEEVKPLVDALKKEHHAARHCCFAYRIGCDGAVWRANDDGEPSSSAGRPILAAIDSAGLSDTLVVVVRYFGGILLGVPGLIRAYREAAADAIASAPVCEKTACRNVSLHFSYGDMNRIQALVKNTPGAWVASHTFDLECDMVVSVPLSLADAFEQAAKGF